jgi:type VI secretion system secreted protein VgrG
MHCPPAESVNPGTLWGRLQGADDLAAAVAFIEDRMSELSQTNFPASLKTPLGENVLVLKSFSGEEALGQPFEFHVDALSERENINFDNVLGQACTIKLKTYEQKERFFCGILTNAQWVGSEAGASQDYSRYRLVLRPWFWLLAHRANCRIFLNKKVTDIIEQVFKDAGFSSETDFKLCTQEKYEKIEYCVQYRETDFAFVSRLMEQYGIYYFFEHQDGQHKMMLADCSGSHSKIKDLPTVKYNLQTEGYARAEQHLHSWISERRFCSGKVRFDDYDYLKPKVLNASKETKQEYKRSKFEIFDFPGKYDKQTDGDWFAKVRLEAEQALDRRRSAGGDAPSIFAGGLIKFDKHPVSGENIDYLVVRASHEYSGQFYGAANGGGGAAYHGSYEFLPKDHAFRSLPLTPKPRVHGIQTAKVVAREGEDREEISTDEHGHIWVQFHWDREPQKSCPIRVSQSWAGKQWGEQFIPRIGMEVVVEFLEGDPDRPLVTGCVYNKENKYPYKLPANKTQSGVRSDSSKGHNGYNEFMFEDNKDEELVRMHAQKDHDVTVRNSETWTIGEAFTPPQGQASRTTTLENGDDSLSIKKGGQSTHAFASIETVSNMKVSDAVISESVTSQTLTMFGITLKAPVIVTIDAPFVIIKGNLWVQGGIGMGPACMPVS